MKTKIVGGFSQPIAKLPDNEKVIGHPCPKSMLNKDLMKEINEIIQPDKKGKKK